MLGLLTALLLQVLSGMAANGPTGYAGPLNHFLSHDLDRVATALHQGAGKWFLLALIGLHVATVIYFLAVRKRNLIAPMLHGNQAAPLEPAVPSEDGASSRLMALSLLALSACAVFLLVQASG